MEGLYSLRRKRKEGEEFDPIKGPTFPNVGPAIEPRTAPLRGEPINLLSQGEQLATTLAKAKTSTEEPAEVNPYAFWKTPIGANEEGKGGIPLDLAVTLAGTLASSIAPKEWGGRAGAGLAKLAQAGGKSHEEWIEKQKTFGLEKERVGIEKAKVAKKTEAEYLATPGPEREALITAKEREAKAGKPFDIEGFLQTGTSEEISKYLANKVTATEKLAVAAETPAHKQALEAQRDMAKKGLELHNLQVQLEQIKINQSPEEIRMDKEKHAGTMTKLAQEAKSLSAHADLAEAQAKQVGLIGKGELEDLRASRTLYRQSRLLFEKAWADASVGGSVKKDQALSILTGIVHDHLMGIASSARKEVKTKTGTKTVPDLKEGNESFGYWLSRMDEEFQTSKKGIVGREKKPGLLGIKGQITGERVTPEEDIRWQRHANQLTDFLKIIGQDTYPLYKIKAVDLFTEIYQKVTPSPRMNQLADDMIMLGEAFGIPVDVLQDTFMKRQSKPTVEPKTKTLIEPGTGDY